jgi:hypothetical protein
VTTGMDPRSRRASRSRSESVVRRSRRFHQLQPVTRSVVDDHMDTSWRKAASW